MSERLVSALSVSSLQIVSYEIRHENSQANALVFSETVQLKKGFPDGTDPLTAPADRPLFADGVRLVAFLIDDEADGWVITDVDLDSEKGAEKRRQDFLATALVPPMNSKPVRDSDNEHSTGTPIGEGESPASQEMQQITEHGQLQIDPAPATRNAGEVAEIAQAYVDALMSENAEASALAPDLQQAEIEQLRETLREVVAGHSTIRMTIPVANGDKMLVASDAIKPTVESDRFKDVLRTSPSNAIRVVLRLSVRDEKWVVTDLDLIPDTAVRMPEWGSGLVAPSERFVDEPVLRDLARLTRRPDRHAQVYLSDAIQQFNERQRQDKIGREQPLLTDDEVIAAIRAADYRVVKQDLIDDEFEQFQAIAEMRLLPGSFSRSVKRLPDGAMVFALEEEPAGIVPFYLHYSQGLWRQETYRGPHESSTETSCGSAHLPVIDCC